MDQKIRTFKKILIANRGEIAIRVMKTCARLGIKTVSLYTDIERDYPHASFGDENVNLGSGPLSETYLNIERIVSIAKEKGADAIHPGYGFLSENAKFSEALDQAGIKLIGPSVYAMEAMGDKKRSKEVLEGADVPLIPGYHGDDQDPKTLLAEAKKIGFPVLIKATAGGGGKGMRIVNEESDFQGALEASQREALNAFSNDKVLIEKFIQNPRHIEVQVMSDQHGNHLHFFERECSIQRRYQKIIEETPSPAFGDELRQKICETAVRISSHIDYEGAGTVEFILDDQDHFYFLEMNTRLQVEHPITEMVTGVDLVEFQIRVAEGHVLSYSQDEIKQTGHAIEVRLYAENPDNNFLPTVGRIEKMGSWDVAGVRLDSGFSDGNQVGVDFDPMMAKLIVWEENRVEAILKMQKALRKHPVLGIQSNREYLQRVLEHPKFREGETFTHFVQTYKDDLCKDESLSTLALGLAAFLAQKQKEGEESPWNQLGFFVNE